MLSALCKALKSLLLLMPCMTALAITGVGSRQSTVQGSTQSTSNAPVYFPPEQTRIPVTYAALASLNEPSLFEAAKDRSVFSFRVSYFSPVPEREIAVRLVVNSDGSGQITSAVSSGATSGVKRTQNNVSVVDVNKLIQLLSKVEFWSISSTEDDEKKTDAAGQKAYVMDGSYWMVEGVHEGSFHYVYRQNPKPSPITEIACNLAKDLAKPDDSAISITLCSPRGHLAERMNLGYERSMIRLCGGSLWQQFSQSWELSQNATKQFSRSLFAHVARYQKHHDRQHDKNQKC